MYSNMLGIDMANLNLAGKNCFWVEWLKFREGSGKPFCNKIYAEALTHFALLC